MSAQHLRGTGRVFILLTLMDREIRKAGIEIMVKFGVREQQTFLNKSLRFIMMYKMFN
jgi:hypothetical protein